MGPSAKIAERAERDGRKIKQQERDSIRSLMELVYETLAATCGRWTELRLAMTWPGFPWASLPLPLFTSFPTAVRLPLSLAKLWASLQDTTEIAYHVRNSGRFELGSMHHPAEFRCTSTWDWPTPSEERSWNSCTPLFPPRIFWSEQLDTRYARRRWSILVKDETKMERVKQTFLIRFVSVFYFSDKFYEQREKCKWLEVY